MKKFAFAALTAIISAGAMAQDFGAPVIDRPAVDLAHQITFISRNLASPAAGEISQWRLWAGGTGDVTLQMWRPIANGWQLVGANTVTVANLGFNTFNIAAGRIAVQAGDVIGFRYNQTSQGTRVIKYTNGAGQFVWTNWPDNGTDVPVGGQILNSQLTGSTEGRLYSVAATVVPEPATLVGLGVLALAAVRRRRA